jgi:hypothetical protein
MSDINHSSRANKLRQRVAEGEQGRARVVSVTATAAVASVVAAAAVAVTVPGHGIGAGQDLQRGRLLALAVGCAGVVGAAVAWRLVAAARQVPRASRVAAVFAEHTSQPSRRAGAGRRPASR